MTETTSYRLGYKDAKGYSARCFARLNGYGRRIELTEVERTEYNAGYDAGAKARTPADERRWLKSIGA